MTRGSGDWWPGGCVPRMWPLAFYARWPLLDSPNRSGWRLGFQGPGRPVGELGLFLTLADLPISHN